MKRTVASVVVVTLALVSCEFAQRHQAVTVGIATGVIGFSSCEIDNVGVGTCGIIGGTAGVVLGGIAAIVTWLADTTDHTLPPDDELTPSGALRVHTHTEPPPVIADAGIDASGDASSPDAITVAP